MATAIYDTGSDALPEFPCAICPSDGRNTEALFECTDCQIFYCQRCVSGHNKFTKYKHNVADHRSKLFGETQSQSMSFWQTGLPTEKCKDHPKQVIEMFCKQHDKVCCVVCIAEKHGSCKGHEYIQRIAKFHVNALEKDKAKTSLEKVKDDLQNLKSRMQTELEELHGQHDGILVDIQIFTKRLIAIVEELELRSVKEVKEKYKNIADDFNTSRKKIDDMLNNVEERLGKLKYNNTKYEGQTFVDIKYGENQVSDANDCIKQYTAREVNRLEFEANRSIETYLRRPQSLGLVWTQEKGAGIRARQSKPFLQQGPFRSQMLDSPAEHLSYMEPWNQRRNRSSWPRPKDI